MKNFLSLILAVSTAALPAGCAKNSPGSFQGYIEGEYVYVASPLAGALTHLAVARGDSVKAGQLLFALERQSEAAAVTQAEKNLAQAQARGGASLSTEMGLAIHKLSWQCHRGHVWSARWDHVKGGSWCPDCAHLNLNPAVTR